MTSSQKEQQGAMLESEALLTSVLKMTSGPLLGTLIQTFFLPRTGLNKSWISPAESRIFYFRQKSQLLQTVFPSQQIKVPPTTSLGLMTGLAQTCRKIGLLNYYRQLWPAGRLLVLANGARYGSQIGLKETSYFKGGTKAEQLLMRVVFASSVEYIINGPLALPYTAGAAKITPSFLLSQVKHSLPPLAIPFGRLGPAPGGIPRLVLKGCQISIQFEIARYSQHWTPVSFQQEWPIANAFLSGVMARSIVEIATVPVRNIGNFRNIGFSTRDAMFRTFSFPLLSSGINVIAKGMSFGIVLCSVKLIESSIFPSRF